MILHLSDDDYKEYRAAHKTITLRQDRLFIRYKSVKTEKQTVVTAPSKLDRHLRLLCPLQYGGVPCGTSGFARHSIIKYHDCLTSAKPNQRPITSMFFPVHVLERQYDPFTALGRIRRIRDSPLQHNSLTVLVNLIAGTPVSITLACSASFLECIKAFIRIGQMNPTTQLDEILPAINRKKLSLAIRDQAQSGAFSVLSYFTDEFVSVMFDSSTINHKKYLGITLVKNSKNAKPLFFQLVNAPSDGNDYATFLLELIRILREYRIEITSICTDGLPAQLNEIAQALDTLTKTEAHDLTVLPFHIPCLNHRINLALVHTCKETEHLVKLIDTIRAFADNSATSEYQSVLEKRCPTLIQSRWLSLSLICSYIRLKRNVIHQHDYLKEAEIISVLKLEILLTPLLELHLFLEREQTKLHQVFPALLRAVLQYQSILEHELFSGEKWYYTVVETLRLLIIMTLTGNSGKLASLAFSLTPIGQYLFSTNRFASGYNPDRPILESVERLFDSFFSSIHIIITVIRNRMGQVTVDIEAEINEVFRPITRVAPPVAIPRIPSPDEIPPQPRKRTREDANDMDDISREETARSSSSTQEESEETTETPAIVDNDISEAATIDDHAQDQEEEPDSFLSNTFIHPLIPHSLATNLQTHASNIFSVSSTKTALQPDRFNMRQEQQDMRQKETEDATQLSQKESRFMPLKRLLTILTELNQKKKAIDTVPVVISSDSEDYGLLEAEESAKEDEFDANQRSISVSRTILTRREARKKKHSQLDHKPSTGHVTLQLSSMSHYSRASSLGIDSESSTDYENSALILERSPASTRHKPFHQIDEAYQFVNGLIDSLTGNWFPSLISSFEEHIKRILPHQTDASPILIRKFKDSLLLKDPKANLLANGDLDMYILTFAHSDEMADIFFSRILRHLLFAPCSESSVERLFSRLRFICGKHRYNLSLPSLNAALIILTNTILQSRLTDEGSRE